MSEGAQQQGFFSGIRGLLTALAALLTAVGGLLGTLHQTGVIGGSRAGISDSDTIVYGADRLALNERNGSDRSALDARVDADAGSREEKQAANPTADSNPVSEDRLTDNRSEPGVSVQRTGTLVLRTVPAASVSVDGQARVVGSPLQVSADARRIRFHHPDYGTKDTTITVRAGQTEELTCYFEHTVQIRAPGGVGTVVVDGNDTRSPTPFVRDQGPGTHRFGLSLPEESTARIHGGTYQKRVAGATVTSTEFTGNEVALRLEPSFSSEVHEVTFNVVDRDLGAEVRDRIHGLEGKLERAIEEQDWAGLPPLLATYYPERLTDLYAKHHVQNASVVVEPGAVDQAEAEFSVTVYVEYQQRGRDGIQHVPIPATWIWGPSDEGVELVRVRPQ